MCSLWLNSSWVNSSLPVFSIGLIIPQVTAPRLSSQAAATKCLRRKVRGEMFFRVTEGAFLAAFGLVTTLFVSGGVLLTAYLLYPSRTFWERFHRPGIFWMWLLLGLAISILVTRGRKWGSDYSQAKAGFGSSLFPNAMIGLVYLARDFVGGGDRLLFSAAESFSKAYRLGSLDISLITPVIVWLWQKGAKANAAEISRVFPGFNTVRVLPQLRDIPGVIWLPDPRGVIFLSGEFRVELADAIRGHPHIPEPPPPFEGKFEDKKAEPQEPDPAPSDEIVDWYATLGLPAYAPIQQVKKRYRQLAKLYHPDALAGAAGGRRSRGTSSENSPSGSSRYRTEAQVDPEEKMKRINLAYQNIMKHSE